MRIVRWMMAALLMTAVLLLPVLVALQGESRLQRGDTRGIMEIATPEQQREQIIRNTVRLDNLEDAVRQLRAGGSATAIETQRDQYVLEQRVKQLEEGHAQMRVLLYSAGAFLIAQLIGLAWMALRYYVDRTAMQFMKHERRNAPHDDDNSTE